MKFRKKSIEIEAIQFKANFNSIKELEKFCGDCLGDISITRGPNINITEAHILTLEDGINKKVKHIATEGDWIIKGIRGEFYPCKPDIFEETYEKVEE